MIKTLIAVPCMDKMDTAFVRSLLALQREGQMAVQLLANSLVYISREELAKFALDNECDYLLFLDSDMIFGEDLFVRLLQAAEEEHADIVTALAFRRRPPFTPCVWEKIRVGEGDETIVKEFDELPEGRFEIDACGMAGCLIKTEWFKKSFEKYQTCFIPLPQFGEDISFCIRAKNLGAKIICDSGVPMGHISQTVVDRATYLGYKEKQDAKQSQAGAPDHDNGI